MPAAPVRGGHWKVPAVPPTLNQSLKMHCNAHADVSSLFVGGTHKHGHGLLKAHQDVLQAAPDVHA